MLFIYKQFLCFTVVDEMKWDEMKCWMNIKVLNIHMPKCNWTRETLIWCEGGRYVLCMRLVSYPWWKRNFYFPIHLLCFMGGGGSKADDVRYGVLFNLIYVCNLHATIIWNMPHGGRSEPQRRTRTHAACESFYENTRNEMKYNYLPQKV